MFFFKKRGKEERLNSLGKIYHSYHLFGIKNQAIPKFEKNQRCKETIILAYILLATAKVRGLDSSRKVTFAELFCADGYYALAARHLGVDRAIGIDNNKGGHFENAEKIRDILGIDNCDFIKMDVNNIDELAPVDIVANIGGLYHVSNPEEILDKSYKLASRYLIVQNVVSLATNDDEYFEAPAPNWTWGSRYSKESFTKLIERKGWNILDKHFNTLDGNKAKENKGSIYFLIEK